LLQYKLIFDFHHTIVGTLRSAGSGFAGLTDTKQLPALDFLRSDVLRKTGPGETPTSWMAPTRLSQ